MENKKTLKEIKDRLQKLKDKLLMNVDGLTPEEHEEFQTLINARNRELARKNNKLARELSYPRGVKQMQEEGVI